MPIECHVELRKVTQDEFARVAYDAMAVFFTVHNDMGRLFDEKIYKSEVSRRHGAIETEVSMDVSFDCFTKRYWIDMLVDSCAIFEVKTARTLVPDHRAQLMNYLLLTGLSRGKLLNVRPETIEHEFVNSLASHDDRTRFELDDCCWQPISDNDGFWKEWLTDALRDWGANLELALYTDAIVHLLGGVERVKRKIQVWSGDRVIGLQEVLLTGPVSMLKVTAHGRDLGLMECHLKRFLEHTRLDGIQWVNVTRRQLTFRTLMRGGGSVI